jgi:hypothetical protein
MNTNNTIMNYWKSWHNNSNWEETRSYKSDDFKIDAGVIKTDSADQLIEVMKKGNPWKDILLLEFLVADSKGILLLREQIQLPAQELELQK